MAKENISQEFGFKNTKEKRIYFAEEIDQNELISKKHKKVCITPYYTEPFLSSAIISFASISPFASLLSITVGILSSAIRLKICAVTVGIKSTSQ